MVDTDRVSQLLASALEAGEFGSSNRVESAVITSPEHLRDTLAGEARTQVRG